MCTVTYIPADSSIFLTSNRDEKNIRSAAVYPEVYNHSSGWMQYPKDTDAGGSWISVHENGNAIVLLNGGIVKHEPKPPYRRSRGLILLDLLDSDSPYDQYNNIDLEGVEPFTVIIIDDNQLYECRWDGSEKYIKILDPSKPHIWSSVTLYPDEIIAKRQSWFTEWLAKNPAPNQEEILLFHQFTGDGDPRNDLLMNRDGETFTVSITSLKLNNSNSQMRYLDLRNNKTVVSECRMGKTTGMLK